MGWFNSVKFRDGRSGERTVPRDSGPCYSCVSLFVRSRSIFTACLSRRILLYAYLPLIAVFYFGSLITAVWLSPHSYDWRRIAISKLLYPGYDPSFHHLASLGVALAGMLILPFAASIRRALRIASGGAADAGAFALGFGAIGLIMAALIVSHPAQGTPVFPRLHEMLARTAAAALGAGMITLWVCVAKAYLASSAKRRQWRWLLVSWSLITLPALLIAILRVMVGAHLDWSNPICHKLEDRALWHLGFWEWLGSAAVFLFLLSAALFLPENDSLTPSG